MKNIGLISQKFAKPVSYPGSEFVQATICFYPLRAKTIVNKGDIFLEWI